MLAVLCFVFAGDKHVRSFNRGCDLRPSTRTEKCHTDSYYVTCKWYCDEDDCNDQSGRTTDGNSDLIGGTEIRQPSGTTTERSSSRRSTTVKWSGRPNSRGSPRRRNYGRAVGNGSNQILSITMVLVSPILCLLYLF